MAGISVAKAAEIFKTVRGATAWEAKTAEIFKTVRGATACEAKTLASGTKIVYKNIGPGQIEKLVTKADGSTFRGMFYNGECVGVVQKTARGTIEFNFGAQIFDKTIHVSSNKGDSLVRLGHKAKPKRFIDYDHSGSKSITGDFTTKLKEVMAYIRGNNEVSAVSKYEKPNNGSPISIKEDIAEVMKSVCKKPDTK